jgi:hypothetical protein
LGYFRTSDATWSLRNQNTTGGIDHTFFIAGADPSGIPLAGDWDGDGIDTVGIYIPKDAFVYTNINQNSAGFSYKYFDEYSGEPLAADWYGFGKDSLAFVSNGIWLVRPGNIQCTYPNPLQEFQFGPPNSFPIAGRWQPY